MSKKFILSYLIDYNVGDISKNSIYLNYLKKINNNKKFYVIDMTHFLLYKSKKNFFKKKIKGIVYFKPKNLFELFNFFKNKKVFVVGPVIGDINAIFIHILLRILNTKIILINFWGFYLNIGMSKRTLVKTSFKSKIKYFINIKLYYYFYRFFSTLGILPKISYYFEASSKRIDGLKNSFGHKFYNKFNNQLFKYFLNTKRINSIFYDRIYEKKFNLLEKKYIVVVDSGYVDHPDYKLRTHLSSQLEQKLRINHYSSLFYILHKLKKKTKKQVIFCLHPKVDYNNNCIKKEKNNFIFVKGQTEKFISKSYMTIFTGGSSLLNMAILNKKKILILLDKDNYYSIKLVSSLISQINLKIILLKKNLKINFNKLDFELNKKLKKYDIFINKHLIYQKNTTSFKQIKSYLNH